MNNNQQPNFFDKNTLLAILLSVGVFFGWQSYMNKKYPKKKKASQKTEQMVAGDKKQTETQKPEAQKGQELKVQSETTAAIKTETFDFENSTIEVTSLGMGFESVLLKKYTDRKDQPITHKSVVENSALFANKINNSQIAFSIKEKTDSKIVGSATVNGMTIVKTVEFLDEKYTADVSFSVTLQSPQIVNVSQVISTELQQASKSFLLPSYENQEFFVINNEGEDRQILSSKDAYKGELSQVSVASVNSQYFALAILNKSDLYPRVQQEVVTENSVGKASISYQTPEPVTKADFKYTIYYGPKDLSILASVDNKLTAMIDYGFFGFIGKPLLKTLNYLYEIFKNWGLAIIALTLLLRTILLPINVYSFRSMKKMQKVQPLIKEIKEKYKNDPQRLNQETMLLMKREKANPLSGCLPMLMQIPIFFAFFQVLGKSIELYKAPFYFWITDLSIKDPFYIFPVLVGILFFFQQKLTPSPGMDPAQKKIMQFLPLIFCVFMISMPSGLTLYMVVNSLFAIAQQYIFVREKSA